jgi:Uma2 family endonuclease
MSLDTQPVTAHAIIYPDSDGQPMADNTLQLEWIFIIKENLDWLFADREDVFVASDLLWYPVEGRPDIRRAPDALVAFGRPKGYRGSYIQHREGGVAPHVVFEILSPNNNPAGDGAQTGLLRSLRGGGVLSLRSRF